MLWTPTVPVAIALVFLGCCSNVIFLELIIKVDPGAGNIVTFSQFLFIALEGLVFVSRFFTVQFSVPLRKYIVLVAFYFVISVINNYVFYFNVPLPLHMIFRAGALMANMVLGYLLMGRRYSMSKYVAVVMITAGIAMATIASAQHMNGEAKQVDETETELDNSIVTLTIGAIMLLVALFGSARMGLFQEGLYLKYGKHPREAMFYTHALSLPAFIFLAPNIWNKIVSFTASEPITVIGWLSIPKMWLYLFGNCITQYICVRGVFVLTTECSALVVTLILTLRKFASLLFSIYYFSNHFTTQHWLGTCSVFLGTALFTGILSSFVELFLPLVYRQKNRKQE